MILVDSNVVIDLLGPPSEWQAWSEDAIVEAGADNELALSPIVVAEVAPKAGSLEAFLASVERFGATVVALSNEAAYAAGVAFNVYRERRRQGEDAPRAIIADFLIGGQAVTLGATIVTRDPRFYRAYFPSVSLIAPDKAAP